MIHSLRILRSAKTFSAEFVSNVEVDNLTEQFCNTFGLRHAQMQTTSGIRQRV